MNIAFDIDGCLVNEYGKPISANIELLKVLTQKHKVYLWSGNGWQHAESIADALKIKGIINGVLDKYNTFKPDIAFDNQEIELGKLNIQV